MDNEKYTCPHCGKLRPVDPSTFKVGDVVYVTKVTPDKEAIRQHVKPHKLAKLGLEIKQVETFYVERSTRDD